MDLKDIGFYTLSDERARNVSLTSSLSRCELILTDACNFKCPYCRGLRSDIKGTMPLEKAKSIIDIWAKEGLKNIRLSGGEPTIYKGIKELVSYAKDKGIERIAMSSNGSADYEFYLELIDCGVSDFSISLDACCSAFGDLMAGGISGIWNKIVSNIRKISQLTYVTVGVVVTEETVEELRNVIDFADDLGVSDIRIISAAQYNKVLDVAQNLEKELLDTHPILKYRINNIKNNRNVRGIRETDSHKCGLVIDDMAIAGNYHFPCIIYMREQGNPIGEISENMRQERYEWFKNHNCKKDSICQKNCLDVCIDYNNKYIKFNIDKTYLPKLDSSHFDWIKWRNGSIHDLGIDCRFPKITSPEGKEILKKYAIGWSYGESISCRPKENHIAVMFDKDGDQFWFHLRNGEFFEVFVDY